MGYSDGVTIDPKRCTRSTSKADKERGSSNKGPQEEVLFTLQGGTGSLLPDKE